MNPSALDTRSRVVPIAGASPTAEPEAAERLTLPVIDGDLAQRISQLEQRICYIFRDKQHAANVLDLSTSEVVQIAQHYELLGDIAHQVIEVLYYTEDAQLLSDLAAANEVARRSVMNAYLAKLSAPYRFKDLVRVSNGCPTPSAADVTESIMGALLADGGPDALAGFLDVFHCEDLKPDGSRKWFRKGRESEPRSFHLSEYLAEVAESNAQQHEEIEGRLTRAAELFGPLTPAVRVALAPRSRDSDGLSFQMFENLGGPAIRFGICSIAFADVSTDRKRVVASHHHLIQSLANNELLRNIGRLICLSELQIGPYRYDEALVLRAIAGASFWEGNLRGLFSIAEFIVQTCEEALIHYAL